MSGLSECDALPHTDPEEIKKNLVAQLTASVHGHRLLRIWLLMVLPTSQNVDQVLYCQGLIKEDCTGGICSRIA